MTLAAPASPNQDQITYWNSHAGERWRALQARIDAAFAPLTRVAVAHAAVGVREAVLDVGCGCGATTLELARANGAPNRVLGVDISEPMLGLAVERGESEPGGAPRFLLADAAIHPFERGGFDLVFSRFGVMFFADPVAAFRNLRSALAPSGRLLFICWQPLALNPWLSVPLEAVRPLLPPEEPADPHAPGPFAFADAQRVRGVLKDAGFTGVAVTPHATSLRIAGPGDLAAATDFSAQIGPAARAVAAAEPDARTELKAAIGAALASYAGPEGVTLGGAIWIVSAAA